MIPRKLYPHKARPEPLAKTMNPSLLHSSQRHSLQVLLLHSREKGSCVPPFLPRTVHCITGASPDAVQTSGECQIPLSKVSSFTLHDIANVWSPLVHKCFQKTMRFGAYSLHLFHVKCIRDIVILNIKEEFCKLRYYEVRENNNFQDNVVFTTKPVHRKPLRL